MLILIALAAISLVPLCIIGSHIVEMVREHRADRVPYMADTRVIDAVRVIRSHPFVNGYDDVD